MTYSQGITDALSSVNNSNAPQLKFATWFGTGVTLGSVTASTPGVDFRQDVTGTDTLTGCTFPDSLQSFMGSNVQTYIQMIPDLSFVGTGFISGTVLTITAVTYGALVVGNPVGNTVGGATAGTVISSFGTGTGGVGTYNLNNSQTVGSSTMVAPFYSTATVTSQFENILQSTNCPNVPIGSRELYQPVHFRVTPIGGIPNSSSTSKPQIDFHITRPGSGGAPAAELGEFYVTMCHFLPSELPSALDFNAGANYYVLFDFKTGGYLGNTGLGDFRIALNVIQGSVGGPLYYKFQADNNANGNWNGSTGIPTVGTPIPTGTFPDGYWAKRSDPGTATSDLGCWIRTHLYVKRPPLNYNRSNVVEAGARDPMYIQNITDGIAYCAVENLTNNTWRTIGVKFGGRLTGCENLPFTRLMNSMCYCVGSDGADPIIYSKATGLQIWNKPNIYLPTT